MMLPPVPVGCPPGMSVLEALQCGGVNRRVASAVAQVLGLDPAASEACLPPGQAQLVALLRALLRNPEILVLVHPLAYVQVNMRERMHHLLRVWQAGGGAEQLIRLLVPELAREEQAREARNIRPRTLVLTGDDLPDPTSLDVHLQLDLVLESWTDSKEPAPVDQDPLGSTTTTVASTALRNTPRHDHPGAQPRPTSQAAAEVLKNAVASPRVPEIRGIPARMKDDKAAQVTHPLLRQSFDTAMKADRGGTTAPTDALRTLVAPETARFGQKVNARPESNGARLLGTMSDQKRFVHEDCPPCGSVRIPPGPCHPSLRHAPVPPRMPEVSQRTDIAEMEYTGNEAMTETTTSSVDGLDLYIHPPACTAASSTRDRKSVV